MKQPFAKLVHGKRKLYLVAGILIIVVIALVLFLPSSDDKDFDSSYRPSDTDITTEVSRRTIFLDKNQENYDSERVAEEVTQYLIDKNYIEQYAAANNISVSDVAVSELYKQRVNSAGSEEELLRKLSEDFGITEQSEYLEVLRYDLLRSAVQEQSGQSINEILDSLK